jgi:hypothetical protein
MADPPLPLKTGSYASWRPEFGVPVRITVGRPRAQYFAEPYESLLTLAPWELFSGGRYLKLPEAEELQLYRGRLDMRRGRLISEMAQLAERIDGQTAVLLCYEDVWAGEICHRRWFAEWASEVMGWQIDEIPRSEPSAPLRAGGAKKRPRPDGPPCLW